MDLSQARWRKSSRSNYTGCVEVAALDAVVAVRDSKNPDGGAIAFSADQWNVFVECTKRGEFDH